MLPVAVSEKWLLVDLVFEVRLLVSFPHLARKLQGAKYLHSGVSRKIVGTSSCERK